MNVFPTLAPLHPHPTPPPQKKLPVCCVTVRYVKFTKTKVRSRAKLYVCVNVDVLVKSFNFVSTVMQMEGLRPGHSLRLLQRHH